MHNSSNVKGSLQFLFLMATVVALLIIFQSTFEINKKIQNIEKLQNLYYKQLDLSIAETKANVDRNRNDILVNREETLKNREEAFKIRRETLENRKVNAKILKKLKRVK